METINGAKLTVTVLIDDDKVNELKAQGYSDLDIEKAICKAITIEEHSVSGKIPHVLITDLVSVELVKYY